jgi:hypothetical protein
MIFCILLLFASEWMIWMFIVCSFYWNWMTIVVEFWIIGAEFCHSEVFQVVLVSESDATTLPFLAPGATRLCCPQEAVCRCSCGDRTSTGAQLRDLSVLDLCCWLASNHVTVSRSTIWLWLT